jgi:hypothetical protein
MKRSLYVLGVVAIVGALGARANAADQLVPGKLFIAKAGGKLVKFLSKGTFSVAPDPTATGASLHVFDEGMSGGDDTYSLPAAQWSGLGSPAGAKGWKYKGAGTAADPCKIVLIKTNLIKAVCKDKGAGGVLMTPPFTGGAGVVLAVGTDNYCAEFTPPCVEIKNDTKLVKRKEPCAAPAMCPSLAPPGCPLAAGEYTTTQLSGGALKVYTFAAFPFPAGGQIKQDVAAASLPNCIHDTVVPFPGGFSAPNFCVPALGYTTSVTQTGCGIGEMDSNGGSHFKVEETNDTSNTGAPCTLPHAGCVPGADASTRVDITVGGGAGTCAGTGTVNAIVTVPVHTKTWQDNSAGTFGGCMGDGVFNGTDMVITEFNQILDFTTDDAHSSWSDIDADGCSLAGGGPAVGQPLLTGECLDITKIGGGMQAVRTVAAGGFGSTGLPDDGSFSTDLPNKVDQTGPFLGTTCGSPPVINFTGTATRCIP